MRLAGKTALVTGAARGIGLGIANAFVDEGATVIAVDLDLPDSRGGEPAIHPVIADVTRRGDVDAAAARAIELTGRLDIAVCNAGFLRYQSFLELDVETWQAHIDVDLTGVFHTAQASARIMSERGGGSIIVITSVSAEVPSRAQGHYCAAKAGAQMLADAMAWELGQYKIRVNSIGPGWVETRLTEDYLADPASRLEVEQTIPLGRVGEPADIARAAVFLASEESAYMTGAHLRVDGGLIIGKDKT